VGLSGQKKWRKAIETQTHTEWHN